jgi:hypothetical protein
VAGDDERYRTGQAEGDLALAVIDDMREVSVETRYQQGIAQAFLEEGVSAAGARPSTLPESGLERERIHVKVGPSELAKSSLQIIGVDLHAPALRLRRIADERYVHGWPHVGMRGRMLGRKR